MHKISSLSCTFEVIFGDLGYDIALQKEKFFETIRATFFIATRLQLQATELCSTPIKYPVALLSTTSVFFWFILIGIVLFEKSTESVYFEKSIPA